MRRIVLLSLFLCIAPAAAQQALPKMEPLPEPPPKATALDEQGLEERGVRIQPGERAEEYMVEGKRVIRVRTLGGKYYYLVEQQPGVYGGRGHDPSDTGLRVPQWVIEQW